MVDRKPRKRKYQIGAEPWLKEGIPKRTWHYREAKAKAAAIEALKAAAAPPPRQHANLTFRASFALHDRLRNFTFTSRQSMQAIMEKAVDTYLRSHDA